MTEIIAFEGKPVTKKSAASLKAKSAALPC